MDRASLYFMEENGQNTYDFDETLPPLPLPDLPLTLQRYYETLKPFGTAQELANARTAIATFESGVGAQLQAKLKERASKMKNWLDGWWDAYAYHLLRFPLNPYMVMALPFKLEPIGIPETAENLLKNFARITYHTIEFWDLLHKAKIRPLSSNGGKIKYSSALYKQFFSTTRVPGVEVDHIEKHFRAVNEGKTPTHGLISGKGRLFVFECLHPDGSLITPQELLIIFQRVRSTLDYEPMGDCVPILTHDDRTTWAHNRQRLRELSPGNEETLNLVESSSVVTVFDENEPRTYTDIAQQSANGDYHSKWGDRSSTFIGYKNGKFSCVGEHSAYDGTVSVSYVLYIQLSMHETPEPDWSAALPAQPIVETRELKFDLDEPLRQEIQRALGECEKRRTDVQITHEIFDEYGKEFIKTFKVHPDSFVQVIMQLAYNRLHNEIVPIYETALMRHYYNGRTETLRSCTNEVYAFLQLANRDDASGTAILKAFRSAVNDHTKSMDEVRKGHGVDRHLFGLWCVAYENKMEIPEFYSEPLYLKSGGGGNFVLSTSTLGYSVNVGFVAPMVLDGYGVFYTITPDSIYIQTTAFRDSAKTSAHKFNQSFMDTFRWIKRLIDAEHQTSRL